MSFERVILHIGLGKTGSSAIQQSLCRHARQLELVHGILVPVINSDPRPFAGNHSLYLRSLCSDTPESLRFNIAAGLDSKALVHAADTALRAEYERIFLSSSASTLLLSAEGVGHFDEDAMAQLAHWLYSLSPRVDVLACVRHPRHALAAEIQQRLKTGAVLERLYERPPFYRYSQLFSRVAQYFGSGSISLYDYAAAIPPQGDAWSAFQRQIGVNLPPNDEDQRAVNVGLSFEATLLLDALNRLQPLLIDGRRNPLRRPGDLAAIVQFPGSVYRPPEEVYSRLDEMSAPELDWLQEHYCFFPAAINEHQVGGQVKAGLSPAEIESLALALASGIEQPTHR